MSVDLEHGDPGGGVNPDNSSRHLVVAGEADPETADTGDDAAVCEDVAGLVDHEARSKRALDANRPTRSSARR